MGQKVGPDSLKVLKNVYDGGRADNSYQSAYKVNRYPFTILISLLNFLYYCPLWLSGQNEKVWRGQKKNVVKQTFINLVQVPNHKYKRNANMIANFNLDLLPVILLMERTLPQTFLKVLAKL